jgi:hypothetical protein
MMMKQPDEITICKLEVCLMPNGEVICMGQTLGWFKDFKKLLEPVEKLKKKCPDISPTCDKPFCKICSIEIDGIDEMCKD